MSAIFGPAGNSESFSLKGYKKNTDIPTYLQEFGLTTYEYQCGRGVNISEASAKLFGEAAKAGGIVLSLHSPYYISLSSEDPAKRDNSIEYLMRSARAADAMGADRIVVHSGSCAKMSREQALELAGDTLLRAREALEQAGYGHIRLCPETMGKINQLGNLEEVMALCRLHDSFLPCIDFGHLNARTFGTLCEEGGFEAILNTIEQQLGQERLQCFHAHFSKIEYTLKGGEKRHLTFEDQEYGPDFAPLAKLLAQKKLSPRFICESAGTQAEDAAAMQQMYREACAQMQA